MFYMLLPDLEQRQALINHLRSRAFTVCFIICPAPFGYGRKFGGKPGDCPVTEKVSDQLIRLPFYNDLTEADQVFVVQAIKEFNPN